MKNKATIYSIAKELGMSASMVSRGLSKNGSVDAKKRELILKTAEKYNYTPNRFASQLSKRNVKIGILFYGKFRPAIAGMIQGIEAAYQELKDYKIEYEIKTVWATEKSVEACRKELFDLISCDGVIVSGFSSESCQEMLEEFIKENPNLVFLQTENDAVNSLFSSKHDERTASTLSCEMLSKLLKHAERKNVLLFTGDTSTKLHMSAKQHFLTACREYGLQVLDSIDMKDNREYFEDILPGVMNQYADKTDGIYITSAISVPLCQYIQNHHLDVSLVTFDLYDGLTEYIENGIITATVFQDIYKQAKNAFEELAKFIVLGTAPRKKIYTDVQFVMKSNMRQYHHF